MAHLYVDVTGSNTSPYDTRAKAANKISTAVNDAACVPGSTVWVFSSNGETADTTLISQGTNADPVRIIATTDTVNVPPITVTTGVAYDSSATAGVDLTFQGAAYMYGIDVTTGGGGTAGSCSLGTTDEDFWDLESCTITIGNTNTSSRITISGNFNNRVRTRDCKFVFGSASQGLTVNEFWESIGDDFAVTGIAPTTLVTGGTGGAITLTGADLSAISGTLVGGVHTENGLFSFYACKLNAAVTPMAAPTTEGHNEVVMYDCHSGDVHYNFYHESYKGKTEISSTIYVTAGASPDGTTVTSWKVTGTANATLHAPYRTPWIHAFNTDVATAVTPRFEILRDGSATAYKDDEVWGEWLRKNATSVPRVGIVTDRKGLAAAAANQATSALGAGDWTGENATSWFGKLEPSAFTPAEEGYVSGRVCVAGAITVYVNPEIRGLSTVSFSPERVAPFGFVQSNIAVSGGASGGGRPIGSGGLVG